MRPDPASSTHRDLLLEPWDRLSVASLVAGAAAGNATGAFIADCPDRLAWNGAEPRRLSFGEFHRRASFVGAQLAAMGLKPGERVLILMPNSVDGALAIIGSMIAGFVPALAAIDESVEALRASAIRAGIRAILTTDRVENLLIGEKARQVAARAMSVRFVAGFGEQLPEGITPFDGWSEEDVAPLPALPQRRQSAEALVTFGRDGGAVAALVRSEAQVIADALAFAASSRVERGQAFISLLHPGSPAQIAAGLLMPLFVGAHLRLVGPFSGQRLAAVMGEERGAVLLAPGGFLGEFAPASEACPPGALAGVIAHVRFDLAGEMRPLPPSLGQATCCLDFDGRGLAIIGNWPEAGIAALAGSHPHPMAHVLPEGEPYFRLTAAEGEPLTVGGFGAARMIGRDGAATEVAA